jgi:hypothetical protein
VRCKREYALTFHYIQPAIPCNQIVEQNVARAKRDVINELYEIKKNQLSL